MQTLLISNVKDRLNELVDAASVTPEQVTITKPGSPAGILVGFEEWEFLQETLFWSCQPEIQSSINSSRAEVKAGRGFTEKQVREEFGIPKQ